MQHPSSHYTYVTGESPASASALIPCLPASLHPAQVPLIGLEGHLPAFIVLEVKRLSPRRCRCLSLCNHSTPQSYKGHRYIVLET